VPTILGRRYDVLVHFDETSALRPLDAGAAAGAEESELEAFPSGT
jgi:hypothetical protein